MLVSRLFCCGRRRRSVPVGDPAQQCWQYVIRDPVIKGGVHRAGTDRIGGEDDCVGLQSATLEDGIATYIICCRKDEGGACKKCFTLLKLEVFDAADRTNVVATKQVTLECSPAP